ncbi:GNAT family N-acetyltransferase [Micromonospora sp. KC606]|uniref:GNAT family N-acetyltransferase n=1 Tax=Micromonospora sp. KC606 TaxID=2530379 RepID=UPI00140501A3|nr:GNAT family N-acetyltransferase [Micromonospora sp. KC606]
MALVVAVLDQAAAWLTAAGIKQWPDRFETEWVAPSVERGETWLVRIDGRTAGTMTLDWSDPLWSDRAGKAGYVHRMAVERWAAGIGRAILTWAADQACAHGGATLRLDCVAANRGLRAYYEAAGFQHRGDVEVGGAPGQRSDDGIRTLVSRYELPL